MSKWLIAVPCWGDSYRARFLDVTLPGIKAALSHAGNPEAAFVIQTDDQGAFKDALDGFEVAYQTAPTQGDKYSQFGDAHRSALAAAQPGQWVMLMTADAMLSREAFAACESRFNDGKKAVAIWGPATWSETPPLPGMDGASLMAWGVENLHDIVKAAFWGGTGMPPSFKLFRNGDNITARCFHMHPLAVVKDRDLSFSSTCDVDLLDCYATEDIHVVTHPSEMAVIEMSPRIRPHSRAKQPVGANDVALWARRRASPMHRWLSTHRLIIAGSGETYDEDAWSRVLNAVDHPAKAFPVSRKMPPRFVSRPSFEQAAFDWSRRHARSEPGIITALILGGGETVFADAEAALSMFTPSLILATNDVGAEWPSRLHCWCSMHPDQFNEWADRRAGRGYGPAESYWTGEHRVAQSSVPVQSVESLGGGTGLLAIRVAKANGARRIVLAGIPLNKSPHFFDAPGEVWKEAHVYHRFFVKAHDEIVPFVRSMSGFTRDTYGYPTPEWCRGMDLVAA